MALGEGATLSPRKQAGAQSASADSRNQELSAGSYCFVVCKHKAQYKISTVIRIFPNKTDSLPSKRGKVVAGIVSAGNIPPDRFAKLI